MEKALAQKIMEGCWKRVGVWSRDPQCPELAQVIHCRNCDVFTKAGRNLLDRDLPDGYRQEWANVMAAKKEEEIFNTISVIIFRISDEWLAIRTRVFSEVLMPDRLHIHAVPHRKNTVLIGIINVRGEIQLYVSIKNLLGIEGVEKKESKGLGGHRVMVLQSESGKWVFPVDEILGIYRIDPNTFENVPVTVAKAQSTYTRGIFKWEDKHVAYLDDELMIHSLIRNVQ